MISSNIIEILKKLDKKEIRRFGEFIKSPYFNSISKLKVLYDIIVKEYPGFPREKLNAKKIFKKLYPGKEYREKTIRNLYTEFGRILRKFLAYEEISLNEDIIDLYLAKGLSRKGAYEISDKFIDEKKEKTEYKNLGKSYYWYMYKLECQRFYNLFKEDKFDYKKIYETLHNTAEDLVGFFFTAFSNTGYNILFALEALSYDGGNPKLTELVKSFDKKRLFEYLDASGLKNSDSIKVYYLLLHYFADDFTEKDYYEIKEILIKNAGDFNKVDLLNFWSHIMDIIIVKLIPLDNNYYREILDISKHFRLLNIYPDNSVNESFPLSMFRNIIFTGLLLDEFEWTEEFLDEYSNYIEPDQKENELNYNKGILYFNYKKYEESLLYLNKVKITDIYGNFNVRFYMTINHIELRNYDSAACMINSIKQFSKTSKDIPELIKTLAKASLKYLGAIIKCEETNTKLDYPIYKEALGPQRYYNKKYILSKMEQLL